MGDVVNTVAARTAAEPGTVLVGPIPRGHPEFIRYRSVGQLHARGRGAGHRIPGTRLWPSRGTTRKRRAAFRRGERELDLVALAITNAYETRRGLLLGITEKRGWAVRIAGEIMALALRP